MIRPPRYCVCQMRPTMRRVLQRWELQPTSAGHAARDAEAIIVKIPFGPRSGCKFRLEIRFADFRPGAVLGLQRAADADWYLSFWQRCCSRSVTLPGLNSMQVIGAMGFLTEYGILSENEAEGSRRVLRAAAMTYVAAAAAALLNLLRLVMLSRRNDRRD